MKTGSFGVNPGANPDHQEDGDITYIANSTQNGPGEMADAILVAAVQIFPQKIHQPRL